MMKGKIMSSESDKKFGCLMVICVMVIIIVVMIPCSISWMGGMMPNYSEGERTGVLIQHSKKGVIWKSWEGSIILNEFNIGKEGSNLFEFSTLDDKVGKELEEMMGKKVIIRYNHWFVGPIQQSTSYTVSAVREAPK